MPLQALVSKLPADAEDVVVVKLDNAATLAAWGNKELDSDEYFVVRLEDDFDDLVPILQAQLEEDEANGVEYSCIVYPFTVL